MTAADFQHPSTCTVHPVQAADLPAVAAIHGHYATRTAACAQEEALPVAWWRRRADELAGLGLPFLVAQLDRRVIGYGLIAPWKPGAVYRHTGEVSMYLDPAWVDHKISQPLFDRLLAEAATAEVHQLIGTVGHWGPGADRAIAAARRWGFTQVDVLPQVIYAHGRWMDLHLLQRQVPHHPKQPE
ncbi:N-acetyltransferase family protein [Actinomadura kijaniata]|uniref:GNAT family N-acetyltransferase n=1 Tax=Actinomadura kijaniata TaxID=46161 RepID=UPI003F1E315C